MSNLHDRATRAVSIALVPALLAIGGVLAWELQLLPTAVLDAPVATEARRVTDDTLNVPRLSSAAIERLSVQSAKVETKPSAVVAAPRASATAHPPKVRHCDEYAMFGPGGEKVWVCDWQ
ncbi:MAG: hypothetical protein ACXWP4_25275 [Polyangiales bacterium]